MAFLATAPGVSFGMVDGHPVFLDAAHDRYAALPRDAIEPFLEALARGGRVEPGAAGTARLLASGLFVLSETERTLEAVSHTAPARGFEPIRPQLRLADLGRVWWLVACARRDVRAKQFSTLITSAHNASSRSLAVASAPTLELLVQRFLRARAFVPIASSCLWDSLALRQWLANRGHGCAIVFATRLDPFAAHCWIEADGIVLNDSPERIATFAPVAIVE
jgi:hypothetical protein